MKKTLKLTESDYGGRLDSVLSAHFADLSRSYLTKAIKSGYVLVNGKSAKAGHKLKSSDKVTVRIDSAYVKPINIPIIYEDENVVVIDKPEVILAHAKGAFLDEFTVNDFMKDKYSGENKARGAIVHRLDRTTSGVMICAKNDETAKFLQKQFSERKVEKTYLAQIENAPEDEEALLDLPIERNPKRPSTFRVGPNGKPSQTEMKVLKSGRKTLVELKPLTGRTHQLRVHMAFLGLPIIGDDIYGGAKASRVMLHATKLEISLPGGDRRTFESEPPKGFSDV